MSMMRLLERKQIARLAFMGGLAVLFFGGCKLSKVEQPVIRKLLVDIDRSGKVSEAKTEVGREDLQNWVRIWLTANGSLRIDEKAEKGATLRVRFSPAPAGKRRGTMGLQVEWVEKEGGDSRRYFGQSEAMRHGSVPSEKILQNAFADAMGQVLSVRSAGHLSDAELAIWVGAKDKTIEQKKRAIRVLGNRRSEAALDAMCALVEKQDKILEAEALIALTRMEPKAEAVRKKTTRVLINATAGRSPLIKKQVVRSVERLDTRLGRAWLFTLSTGHPASDVRLAAASALERMESANSSSN